MTTARCCCRRRVQSRQRPRQRRRRQPPPSRPTFVKTWPGWRARARPRPCASACARRASRRPRMPRCSMRCRPARTASTSMRWRACCRGPSKRMKKTKKERRPMNENPQRPQMTTADSSRHPSHPPHNAHVILVVDDALDSLRMLCDALAAEGYVVLAARDADEALQRFALTVPDGVLLDAEHHVAFGGQRSEEHTSELQSRPHLVCRLLLETTK